MPLHYRLLAQVLEDTRLMLRLVSGHLTLKETCLMIALLCKSCKAGVKVIREADELWLKPKWDFRKDQVYGLIKTLWPDHSDLLKLLALEIMDCHDYGYVTLLVSGKQMSAGVKPSVLGCHLLRVIDSANFLSQMQRWSSHHRSLFWFCPTVGPTVECFSNKRKRNDTDLVINLLRLLGLRARLETRLPEDPENPDEPLWFGEYVSSNLLSVLGLRARPGTFV
jgi:hypothetical protein